MKSNIVLIGFMGSGKTSAGRLLARQMGMEFVDMDNVIEERSHKPISAIFAEEGEPHFRKLEKTLVKELSGKQGLVIATGGGVVLDPGNISNFSRTGLVVCLSATPEAILARVGNDTTRPLLASDDKMKKIMALLEARRSLYNAIPHQVDTTKLTVEEVVARIRAIANDEKA
jgi:shikimate kinase